MKNEKKPLAKVFHAEIQGKRNDKYEYLLNNSIASVQWQQLDYKAPYHFFVPKDNTNTEYDTWLSLEQLFSIYNSGVSTDRDPLFINFDKSEVEYKFTTLLSGSYNQQFREKYRVVDSGSYKITSKILNLKYSETYISTIQYRIFDWRFIYYDKKLVSRPAQKAMSHILDKQNVGLIFKRQANDEVFGYTNFFIANTLIINGLFAIDPFGREVFAPLYLYPDSAKDGMYANAERTPNLNMEIVNKIAEGLGLEFVPEKFPSAGGVASRSDDGVVSCKVNRNTENYMELPYNPKLKERARELRKAGNLSEVLLWNQVKNKQFKSYDFDRQKIIGNYIVDFYCSNCNVVIEIDGSSHDEKVEYDAERDLFLEGLGLTVIHILVVDIMKNMDGVIKMLNNHPALMAIEDKKPPRPAGTPPEANHYTHLFGLVIC